MRYITTKLTFIIMLLLLFWGCSSSNPIVKPDDTNGNPNGSSREEVSAPPEEAILKPLDSLFRKQMINDPVELFYRYNARVPTSFEELKESGMVIGIPRCPYDNKFYHEVDKVSLDDPSGFVYRANSDKSYGYDFVRKIDGEYEIISRDKPEEIWEQRLMVGEGEYFDSKLMILMRFYPVVVQVYYRKHDSLPQNITDMFEDYVLVADGWKTPAGLGDEAYFEFGIDSTNQKIYAKYRYTFGSGKIFYDVTDVWKYVFSDDDPSWGTYPFNKTPPADELILNSWFRMDNLEEAYDLMVE